MKRLLQQHWGIFLFAILFSFLFPFLLNFFLSLPAPISNKWIIGNSADWLSFWGVYIGAIGTIGMVCLTVETLKQNDNLIKDQHTPKLSCSLVVKNNTVLVEIKNISPIPAHGVKVSMKDNSIDTKIYYFEETCAYLDRMSFEIPPLGTKHIPIDGLQPYKNGTYDGFITTTLSYNEKQESFNLYLAEINVVVWEYTIDCLVKKLEEINSTIDKLR